MEYIGQTLCATYSELTNPVTGIMKPSLLGYYQREKKVVQVQKGGNGREAMFDVDSLPFKYRREVYKRHPDLERTARAIPFAETVVFDGKAYEFFSGHTFSKDKHLPTEVIDQYVANASIFNRFTEMLKIARSERLKNGNRRLNITEFWQEKAKNLPLVKDELGHDLPTTFRKLQTKYNQYRREGYKALISKHFANKRAARFNDEQEAILTTALADNRNFDAEFIARMYNTVAEEKGWFSITGRTVLNLKKKQETIITAARNGSSALQNKKFIQVKRERPSAPLLYWTNDGWTVEMYYQDVVKNANGHNVTTYDNRACIVIVLDPFNDYPIGYAIGKRECPELIREAFANAINHTRELFGIRYRTCQIQPDNYQKKNLKPFFAVVAEKVTPARVGNAKTKVVEPYNDYLNEKYCKLFTNWGGHNVTAKKENQPNGDALDRNRKSFPDYTTVCARINEIMEFERAIKREAYLKGFEKTPEKRRLPMSDETYLLTFGKTNVKKIGKETEIQTYAIERGGLRPTIKGMKYGYNCFDPHFAHYTHLRWSIRYDETDLSKALAVSEDGSLRFMLEKEYVQPMALADRKEGDYEELQRIFTHNDALKADVTQKLALASETTERFFLQNPDLHNSLAKHLLTNSRGQHKDQLNDGRQLLSAAYGEVEVLPAKTKPKTKRAIDIENVRVVSNMPVEPQEESIYDLY